MSNFKARRSSLDLRLGPGAGERLKAFDLPQATKVRMSDEELRNFGRTEPERRRKLGESSAGFAGSQKSDKFRTFGLAGPLEDEKFERDVRKRRFENLPPVLPRFQRAGAGKLDPEVASVVRTDVNP